MSGPLVSIVVPTYDRAGYVETAIESLLAQDYEALEVIAVDDGSRDETPAVLARIAERAPAERFRWIRQENAGQSAAMNRGWAEAGGELLGYLSSDDHLLPGAISRLVAAAEAEPDADVVYPHWRLVDEADRELDTIEAMTHTFADALRWWLCMPGVGVLIRRACLDRVGPWDPANRVCPDFEWFLRAGDARFLCVPEVLGAWRVHPGSISVTQARSVGDMTRRWLEIAETIFARDDLPPEIAALEPETYAALLISAGSVALQGRPVTAPRFNVEDLVAHRHSVRAAEVHAASLAALRAAVRDAAHRTEHEQRVNEQLEATVAALRDALTHREATVAEVRAELAGRDATVAALRDDLARHERAAARPVWVRAGRALTPPALRHRVGTAVHRVRTR